MADEEQNEQTENQQPEEVEQAAEETVSAPEEPIAPAAETEEQPAEEPAAEEPVAEEPAAEKPPAEEAPVAEAEPEPDVEADSGGCRSPRIRSSRRGGPSSRGAGAEAEAEAPAALPASPPLKPKRERPAERKAITRAPKPEHPRGRRQERRGVVVSSGMDKTIVVRVDAVKAHKKYQKVVRRSTKFHAHDEENQAKVGDVVRIVETRPLSKTKNWRLRRNSRGR